MTHFLLNFPQNAAFKDDSDKFSSTKSLTSETDSIPIYDEGLVINESHSTLNGTKSTGSWYNSLEIQDLPSIDPLQEANILLSLNVRKFTVFNVEVRENIYSFIFN